MPRWVSNACFYDAKTERIDCLPGIGHACGHNLIASASVLGAVATAEMMRTHTVPGKVVLFGTPAEEGQYSTWMTSSLVYLCAELTNRWWWED